MGSSGSGDGYDKKYNARMATIAEAQQEMAQKSYDWMWGEGLGEGDSSYMDLQQAQINSNMELLPEQTGIQLDTIKNQRALMPEYFDAVKKGLDVRGRMNEASADVTQAYSGVEGDLRREASRMGMAPSSNRTLSRLADVGTNRARAVASARTNARRTAETENLTNMRQAMEL